MEHFSFLDEFASYLRYARRLDFFEAPDYDYCWNLFKSIMDRNGWTCDDFDWTPKLPVVRENNGRFVFVFFGFEKAKRFKHLQTNI